MRLDDRDVVDAEVDGVDTRDYPDFCDAYFSRAIFADTGEELNEAQLDRLKNLYWDELFNAAMEYNL